MNGFHVTRALDEVPAAVPIDFRHKPFVALVTYLAENLFEGGHVAMDGSIRGCDALLTKPLWTRNGWLWRARTRRTRSWKRMSITWVRV